jgi:hypothetical protein
LVGASALPQANILLQFWVSYLPCAGMVKLDACPSPKLFRAQKNVMLEVYGGCFCVTDADPAPILYHPQPWIVPPHRDINCSACR